MIFYSDNSSRFQKVFFGLIFLIPFVLIGQERGEELYERNLEASEYIKSFQMNLSPNDPVYRERSQALRAEDRFNNLMELSYERQVDNWPNDEFELILEAFDIRKEADYNFEDQFFGDAAVGYDQASEIIEEVIDSADIKVRELLEEGELYLYEDEKPEWAESYFREALPYDPENRDILRGIKLIEGLLSFDDTKASLDDLISSNQFDRAAEEIEILKEVLPNELNQELREYEYLIEYKKEETEILAKLEDQLDRKDQTLSNFDEFCEENQSCEQEIEAIISEIEDLLPDLEYTYSNLFDLTGDTFYQEEDTSEFYRDEIIELNYVIEERERKLAAAEFAKAEEKLKELDKLLDMNITISEESAEGGTEEPAEGGTEESAEGGTEESAEGGTEESAEDLEIKEVNLEEELELLSNALEEIKSITIPEEDAENAAKKEAYLAEINKQIETNLNNNLQIAESEENWQDAMDILQDLDEFNSNPENRNRMNTFASITKNLSSIERYESTPSLLFNRNELSKANQLLDSIKEDAKIVPNAAKLNVSIKNFSQTVKDAELFVAEAEKEQAEQQRLAAAQKEERRRAAEELKRKEEAARREAEAARKSQQKASVSNKPQSSSTSSSSNQGGGGNAVSVSQKPKLDYASFGQSVYCPRSYRNREFIPTFKIVVSSDGQAKSIETLYIRKSDGSDMEMNGNDNKILEIVNDALLRSKFRPGRMDDIAVETTVNLPLKIPARFCG